jgi:hypothetical protein
MKQIIASRPHRFHLVRPIFAAALGLAALAAIGTPASAHERDHGREVHRDWRGHGFRHEDWRWHRPAFFGAFAPAPVYVPQYVPQYVPEPAYVPAPVYAPPASFNLVVPLHIR